MVKWKSIEESQLERERERSTVSNITERSRKIKVKGYLWVSDREVDGGHSMARNCYSYFVPGPG